MCVSEHRDFAEVHVSGVCSLFLTEAAASALCMSVLGKIHLGPRKETPSENKSFNPSPNSSLPFSGTLYRPSPRSGESFCMFLPCTLFYFTLTNLLTWSMLDQPRQT